MMLARFYLRPQGRVTISRKRGGGIRKNRELHRRFFFGYIRALFRSG